MKETIMYCQEFTRPDDEKFYTHFYPHPKVTKMCGDEPILKVMTREIQEGEESGYWAWWSYEKDDPGFLFCYPTKALLKMCFAYGMKAGEEAGRGIGINVMIEVIEVVKDV